MTIIFTPVISSPATFLGPGYGFSTRTTFGPVGANEYSINVQLRDTTTGQTAVEMDQRPYTPGAYYNGIFGLKTDPNVIVSQGAAGGVYGNDASVEVTVFDLTNSVVFDGPTTFQGFFHDPVGNLYVLLDHLLSASSGNFTATDSNRLAAVYAQTVLRSYQTVLTHVGLVDNGSITTAPSVRALRVTVTSFPPGVIRDPGTPEYFFNLGFVTLNVTEGWVRSARLVFEFQTYEAPAALDSFGWTLRNGTVINVEELVPVQ